jgi:hypothetical protein
MVSFRADGQGNDYSNIQSWSIQRNGSTDLFSMRAWKSTSGSFSYSQPFLYSTTFDGSTNVSHMNGTPGQSIDISGSFGSSGVLEVGRSALGGAPLNGSVSEVILYNLALPEISRINIEGHLAHKWGLASSLPNTHPFKNALTSPVAPVISGPFTPRNLANLEVWFDADTIPASSGALSLWKDQSGNGRDANQSTSGDRPSGGRQCDGWKKSRPICQ